MHGTQLAFRIALKFIYHSRSSFWPSLLLLSLQLVNYATVLVSEAAHEMVVCETNCLHEGPLMEAKRKMRNIREPREYILNRLRRSRPGTSFPTISEAVTVTNTCRNIVFFLINLLPSHRRTCTRGGDRPASPHSLKKPPRSNSKATTRKKRTHQRNTKQSSRLCSFGIH
ncbi:BnaA06g10660D [Brassica napus]|uniref:BnaA06g10660D protein n=1 Tax=Brassica napus TaxID=3708 RepID=A0A078HBG4_BRANA|nr:BnaA06g10660D [Brassica napus]